MKIGIYTVIPDKIYDVLPIVKIINSNIDYICFTNNEYINTYNWQITHIPDYLNNLSSNKINRYIKIFPNKMDILAKYDYTIYIDANSEIIGDFSNIINIISEKQLSLYLQPHSKRTNIHDEAHEVVRIHKDNIFNVSKIIDFIDSSGFKDNLGLSNNNILIRKNNDLLLNDVMELWWKMVNNYCKRDQLSLMYCLWYKNFENKFEFINRNIVKQNVLFTKHKLKNLPLLEIKKLNIYKMNNE